MGLFTAIFGGSRSKQQSQSTSSSQSNSYNQAYPWLQETYAPTAQTGAKATSAISSLLGLESPGAYDSAYRQFQDSTGFQDRLNTGMKAITRNRATSGLLGSGATLRRLNDYGQLSAKSSFTDYLAQLLGLVTSGQDAAKTIGAAGQVSNSSSTSQSTSSGKSSSDTGAFGQFLGSLLASDPRLKENITHVGKVGDLNVYDYTYIWDDKTIHRGYMADEVSLFYPEALGPLIDGKYMTVDYAKLPPIGDM